MDWRLHPCYPYSLTPNCTDTPVETETQYAKTNFLEPLIYKCDLFTYQDRLGTNIGNTQQKTAVCLRYIPNTELFPNMKEFISDVHDLNVSLFFNVSENGLFEQPMNENDHFSKTGSGQT
jgi:hypothetical protein